MGNLPLSRLTDLRSKGVKVRKAHPSHRLNAGWTLARDARAHGDEQ
jgi:hypothetical protein